MTDAFGTLGANKQICTGSRLDSRPPDLSPIVTTKEEFDSLVSDYSTFFREEISSDVGFLRRMCRGRAVVECDRTIYALRTAKQHADNAEATTFYEAWQARHDGWQASADALADLLRLALEALAEASARVKRDGSLRSAWREKSSVEPETIFDAVCADLNLSFGRGRKEALLRNVERRLKNSNSTGAVRDVCTALCVDEVTGEKGVLPVSHADVLDRLGLLGKRQSVPALWVAYSVAKTTPLKGEAYLLRVEEAWKLVSSNSS